ncbi:hypothetical protein AZI86_10245 [Bdellovibrio bacteriovorus]|uniref:Polyphosphate kinase-2-related domain-containing protein n=1 Tax=Bdellovibrio bacteriovorus TaxID=959 RepID=A0A150WT31_BDEBC|nr:PPK2 family polyphosphate kinase [Bdellovibrio bacteriovorus]KYG67365.1 hypothetical protein AZI86_10245 [Bdellovibrio bacteriovorus]
MKLKASEFIVKPGREVSLKKTKTGVKPLYKTDADGDELLKEIQKDIAEHQQRLYAQSTWAVLIVLQGMDTAGKDGLIKHVLKDVDPQGCSVTSFKKPSGEELKHDFLWRTHTPMAVRGEIKVFNRSYYEDVIVPYVMPEILDSSRLPEKIRTSKNLLKDRCEDIVSHERYLANQGILVIKIFLHLSKKEQKNRLLARFDDASKNWKVEEADITARGLWDKYQKAYEFCLSKTSHKAAPWYIIPADDKPTARLIASKIITEKMAELNLDFPKLKSAEIKHLKSLRKRLKD